MATRRDDSMFVAAEFQNMRSRCSSELEKLLEKPSISIPDWSGDEYRIYEKLDDDITKKNCADSSFFGIGGIILAVLGVASLIAGVRGKTVKTSKKKFPLNRNLFAELSAKN